MANVLYPKYKEALLSGATGVSLSTGNVKLVLVKTSAYTYSAAHDFLDDVPSGARVASTAALSGKTVTNGVFDADDPTISGITGDPAQAVVLYIDSGDEETSRLVAYIDTAPGLPYSPSGGNLTFVFDNGANKIFAL